MESTKSWARKSRGKGSHGDDAVDDTDVVYDNKESSINRPSSAVVIFFVRAGLLPKCRIDILAQKAQDLGATVVKEFKAPVRHKRKKKKLVWAQQNPHPNTDNRSSNTTNSTPPLTHFVVAKEAKAVDVAFVLGFDSVDSLQSHILKHGIECAIPEWISEADGTLDSRLKPRWVWLGISSTKLAVSKKRSHESESGRATKNSRPSSSASSPGLLGPPVPSDDEDETTCSAKTRAFPNNIRLAEAFRQLGKLHESAALIDQDQWKSYSLDKTAGRIRNLDFEVTLEEESLKRLASMPGIGKSTIGKVTQFLSTGEIRRTREFLNDPERVAMSTIMKIWGVGKSKARNLVREGYRTIADVGDGLEKGKILFDRNQCIGFQCYDDFLEEMTREEVEAIAKIVDEAVRRQFTDHSKLEITIMGSYRRGKPKCGDVDVLITHQGWVDTIRSETLGEVVDQLFDAGHIAHHLTFIPGMKECQKAGKGASSSYMGVFNSPVEKEGKRRKRRIDIKFYPYSERAFAFLYFTGNGFFNRSMRFYADVQKGLQLSDHGLFDRRTKERVMEARDEKEVFEYLGLEYKEPHERNGFDDVVSVCGNTENEREEITQSAFFGIEAAHTRWID